MRVIELILDESEALNGIEAISIVSQPAIESDFIALTAQQAEVKLKAVDEEKRILMGAALIPNKMIYRKDDATQDEYYVYFNASTVRRASQLFLERGNQNSTTIEHQAKLTGLSVIESWIVEGEQDKSRIYGLSAPIGTWMVSIKVNNENVWQEFVKTGMVKGFSIEGYFSEKAELAKTLTKEQIIINQIKELIKSNSN
jgi:hypothetical protein